MEGKNSYLITEYHVSTIKGPGCCILQKGALYREYSNPAAIKISLINSMKVNGCALYYVWHPSQKRDQLLQERICSSGSKFFPLRVEPVSKSFCIQRSKQEFIQVNMTLFFKRKLGVGGWGAFILEEVFIRINTVNMVDAYSRCYHSSDTRKEG